MPKAKDDPFIATLWESLVAAKLGPAGTADSWKDASTAVRDRFGRAARNAMKAPGLGAGLSDKVPVYALSALDRGTGAKPKTKAKKTRR
jgi:hypothetical protein